jgi:hypothetical protein
MKPQLQKSLAGGGAHQPTLPLPLKIGARPMANEVTNVDTVAAVATRRPDYSLTDAEVSRIEAVAEAAPGSWFAVDFACDCCGNTTVSIGATSDAVVGPWFELSRDADHRIQLTTTWLDGKDYSSEFWSLNAALRCVLSMIAEAMDEMYPSTQTLTIPLGQPISAVHLTDATRQPRDARCGTPVAGVVFFLKRRRR